MNTDPKFVVLHMRAKMEGRKYAFCGNCVGGGTGRYNRYCIKHEVYPGHFETPYSDRLCKDWEPAERGGDWEGHFSE